MVLLLARDLANQAGLPTLEEGLDVVAVMIPIGLNTWVAFEAQRLARGDAQRQPRLSRNADGSVEPLFGRDPPQEGQIAAPARLEREFLERHAVVHGGQPIRRCDWLTLGVADGYQLHIAKLAVHMT